eukprot:2732620-Prymnesium_polylepis.1
MQPHAMVLRALPRAPHERAPGRAWDVTDAWYSALHTYCRTRTGRRATWAAHGDYLSVLSST